jgi:hypothetical protein
MVCPIGRVQEDSVDLVDDTIVGGDISLSVVEEHSIASDRYFDSSTLEVER